MKKILSLALVLLMLVSTITLAVSATCVNGEHNWKMTILCCATCEENGYIEFTCYNCNLSKNFDEGVAGFPYKFENYTVDSNTAQALQAKGHKPETTPSYGNPNYIVKDGIIVYISKKPTCATSGVGYYLCGNCLMGFEVLLDKKEHSLKTTTGIEATCSAPGFESYKECTRCSYSEGATIIPALGHSFIITDYTHPTCTEKGAYGQKRCDRCEARFYLNANGSEVSLDYILNNPIKALGHINFEVDGICDRCLNMIGETTFKDEYTKVEITYTGDNFDKAVEVVVSEEIVNANIAFEYEYKNYKAYDISLLVDGEKVQPNGNVTVKLPLPADFNAELIAVYYVDSNGNKTKIDSKVENGYVIFETDHLSEYVIVDESTKIETPTEPDTPEVPDEPDTPNEPTKPCTCNCHKGGIAGFFFKILNFFQKLFGMNKVCACGVKH